MRTHPFFLGEKPYFSGSPLAYFLIALKDLSDITCSIRQASSVAVLSLTPSFSNNAEIVT